jgi:hypothetical protein
MNTINTINTNNKEVKMRKLSLTIFMGFLMAIFAGYAWAADQVQMVTPDSVQKTVGTGQDFEVNLSYNVSDEDDSLAGLGLKIHYDSSALDWTGFSNVLPVSKVGESVSPQDDITNADNDAGTDKIVMISWAALSGNWPGSGLPLDLGSVNFKAKGNTVINLTASTAAGYGFQADPVEVEVY